MDLVYSFTSDVTSVIMRIYDSIFLTLYVGIILSNVVLSTLPMMLVGKLKTDRFWVRDKS